MHAIVPLSLRPGWESSPLRAPEASPKKEGDYSGPDASTCARGQEEACCEISSDSRSKNSIPAQRLRRLVHEEWHAVSLRVTDTKNRSSSTAFSEASPQRVACCVAAIVYRQMPPA